MKIFSVRVTAFAAALVLGSSFGFASAKQEAFAETAGETAPRVIYAGRESSGTEAAQEAAPRVIFAGQYVSGGTSDTAEAASAEVPASTVQTDVPAAQAAAADSTSQQAAGNTRHRKTAEELQAAMATVPAGPAKAEWGTFFLGNNLPRSRALSAPVPRLRHGPDRRKIRLSYLRPGL